ncbi:hypothetical protein COU59_00710 [Candidatus Pacearchaeota archaeon CG10_big_fil_rev_8_21_14_0_10_34_12]|nr:MAG: hypothetical protein COU59_00710 [Candidatus Pacearchaeota archaeon CG10_big_fil_rev_8_21_14_0_10_34_12]
MNEEDRFDWQEIFELFHKPDVEDFEFKFGRVNEKKIKEILVDRHDFSLERVEKQLEKLRDIREKQKQKGLGDWV